MGLLNYSTSIEVEKSIAEIQTILAQHGVSGILTDYDGAGNLTALSFKAKTPKGEIAFRLPADPAPVMQIINEQTRLKRRGRYGQKVSVVPKKFENDLDQARRVSWRILKDWVEAQMSLIEIGMVQLHQVFLPYAIMKDGKTVFEMVESKGLLIEHKK